MPEVVHEVVGQHAVPFRQPELLIEPFGIVVLQKIASYKFVLPATIAPFRLALTKQEPLRFALVRLTPLKSAPRKFARLKLQPVQSKGVLGS